MSTKIYAKGRKYNVTAKMNDDYSVVIKKGGLISTDGGKSLSGKIIRLRENPELVSAEGKLIKDVTFNSLSTAATFVTGTMSNGFKVWKYENNGKLIQRKCEVDEITV